MKNIEAILSESEVTLTDEQKAAIVKAVNENYKTIADWQRQHDKVQNLTEQLDTAKESLKAFDLTDTPKMVYRSTKT